MRKIDFLSSGLIISLFLFGCSPSNKVKEYMLNDYQFSAAKDNANDIIRLTMNKLFTLDILLLLTQTSYMP